MKNKSFILNARIVRTISTAALFSAAILPVSTVPAKANDVVAELEHTIMCLGLLVTDSTKHLEICGVGDTKIVNLDMANLGTYPPSTTPQQPEQEDPPQDEDSPG